LGIDGRTTSVERLYALASKEKATPRAVSVNSHKRERIENKLRESTGRRLCERPSNTGQSAKRICGHG
jgi:hypothetical protein